MGGLSDSANQNYLALVALIVSVVALITTTLQVLQQYYSSAEGYRRCAKSVMGLWSVGTKRQLRLNEFRIEVVFETPVVFVAPPSNKKGPIQGRDVHYIDGSEKSYRDTRVVTGKPEEDKPEARTKVHTADDERASWSTLLSTLQTLEETSRAWDREQHRMAPLLPPRGTTRKIAPPDYTLAVALQIKTRSWDFIPPAVTKPYATSTICHMVEIAAMLGLHWKVFDQTTWIMRAEGNGLHITSGQVPGLGLMFTFSTTYRSKHKENRVIPCDELKKLAFGTVPNIYEQGEVSKEILKSNVEHQPKALLEKFAVDVGEEDLEELSLDLQFGTLDEEMDTLEFLGLQADSLKRYKNDHKHIFPPFEVIGMLGKVLRMRGSSFRMLPNPTGDAWRKHTGAKASWKVSRLMESFQRRLKKVCDDRKLASDDPSCRIYDQWLNVLRLHGPVALDENNLTIEIREAIHDIIDQMTKDLLSAGQSLVLSVLGGHLREVLKILENPMSASNNVTLADKESELMGTYFDKIRPVVTRPPDDESMSLEEARKVQEIRSSIWVSLMFRMLCWFYLHDFHKDDVKIIPSNLYGSRMPVYIG